MGEVMKKLLLFFILSLTVNISAQESVDFPVYYHLKRMAAENTIALCVVAGFAVWYYMNYRTVQDLTRQQQLLNERKPIISGSAQLKSVAPFALKKGLSSESKIAQFLDTLEGRSKINKTWPEKFRIPQNFEFDNGVGVALNAELLMDAQEFLEYQQIKDVRDLLLSQNS